MPAEFHIQIKHSQSKNLVLEKTVLYPETVMLGDGRGAKLVYFNMPEGLYDISIDYKTLSKELNTLYADMYIKHHYNGK